MSQKTYTNDIFLNDILNEEIIRLEKLGVDFSKNDYYKSKEFQKNDNCIFDLCVPIGLDNVNLDMPINLLIERYAIGQKRLEDIYSPYDLIITRELTKEERETLKWYNTLSEKLLCTEKDLNQYFYRPQKGLIARLKDLGFDINAFDKSKYIDEKIRLLFFLCAFEYKEYIKLKPFLGNPTLENVSNTLCKEQTKNGKLMKKLKIGVLRGVNPQFVIEAKSAVCNVIRNWEDVIKKVLTLVDYSYKKTQLEKLQQINSIMDIFIKDYNIESLFYNKYEHSLLETVCLKLMQHENIGRENDILSIEEYIKEENNDISINNAEKYIYLHEEIIKREQIKEFIKENKNEIAQFIFEKNEIEKNEYRRLNYILKDVYKYLEILFKNTFLNKNNKLTKLFIYVCIKEIMSLTNEDKIDNFFYGYKTSDQRTLKAELKTKNNSFKKNQLTLILKIFKKYNAYIGVQKEYYVARLIINKIDYIIKELVKRNNIKDILNLNNIISMLMNAAMLDKNEVLKYKKTFETLLSNNSYTINGEEYKVHMFFAILGNTKILDLLLLNLINEISNNCITEKDRNYPFEIENVLIGKNLNGNINITINPIEQKIQIEEFKFIF